MISLATVTNNVICVSGYTSFAIRQFSGHRLFGHDREFAQCSGILKACQTAVYD